MTNRAERPPVSDLMHAVGATTLGNDPSPEAVESVLRAWADTLHDANPLREELERQKLISLPGVTASMVDAVRNDASTEQSPQVRAEEAEDPDTDELYARGREILEADDQLDLFRRSLKRRGYAGDTDAPELIHVGFTGSRLLERPLGIAVRGPSSAGKSFAVETVTDYQPEGAVHDMAGVSKRFLAYADLDTAHSYVVIAEASALHDDGVGATIIRELAWGSQLRYGTLESTSDGIEDRIIERPGPTGLVTTSTGELDEEIATRLVSVHITDGAEQTEAVVQEIAKRAAGSTSDEPDLEPWRAASKWLEVAGDREVVVPYARQVADKVPYEDVRMRRDFKQILTVVRAHALMHQLNRDRDAAGQIIATEADYRTAHRLLSGVLAVTMTSVSDEVREAVEAVGELNEGRPDYARGVSYKELGDEIGLSRQGAHYRCRTALEGGYLANAEERDGYPAKLVTADELPEDRAVLPEPSDIDFDTSSPPTPRDSSLRLDAAGESPGVAGKTPSSEPLSNPKASSERQKALDTSLDGSTAQADGENPEGVKASSEDEGGGGQGDTCRNCGSGGVREGGLCVHCRRK